MRGGKSLAAKNLQDKFNAKKSPCQAEQQSKQFQILVSKIQFLESGMFRSMIRNENVHVLKDVMFNFFPYDCMKSQLRFEGFLNRFCVLEH